MTIKWFMTYYTNKILLLFVSLIIFSCKNDADKQQPSSKIDITEKVNFRFTNALVNETSPYLLQHAHNPVNWLPWSTKAFELAKEQNKLIILSIGYSSCHWCHVMEEESFEDEAVAKLMNDGFISVKVDREERPDVDIVYQTALELVQGSGGWPLNAIILPDGKPVYLGTYHDKTQWKKVINKFQEEYISNPKKMQEYAALLTDGVQDVYSGVGTINDTKITEELIEKGVEQWAKAWDAEWGGDVMEQKFVMPSQLSFLLNYAVLTNNTRIKDHVENTLNRIMNGGIHDHIGGGFFRYSTDSFWKVPHFEKMLYDNAQIISLYSKAFKVFKNPEYKRVVEKVITFLDREMKGVKGGYLSAIDADSDGEEGKFYIWNLENLKLKLGADYNLFAKLYSINKETEWEHGKYVLFKEIGANEFAKLNKIPLADLEQKIIEWENLLLSERVKRVAPKKDDKIITSWNALLIDGLVQAYTAFGEKKYLTQAKVTFQFLMNHNYKNQTLVHSYKKGSKRSEVFLEDYAYLIKSAINLYKVTLDAKYLTFAENLNHTVLEKFTNESGLFWYSSTNELITKIVKTADGVMPSANSVMANNLLEIGHLQYDKDFFEKNSLMISKVSKDFAFQPQSYPQWGNLMLNKVYPYYEIVVVGANAQQLLLELNSYNLPNALIVGSNKDDDSPLFKDRFITGETFIYVCQNSTCKLPVKTVPEALEQLRSFGYKI